MIGVPLTSLLLGLYVAVLAAVGWRAEQSAAMLRAICLRSILYSLSLAALCSSWTYFASVGDARNGSWLYFANALGPIIAITFGFPVWRRIAKLAKQENVGSLADFLAARYGKSRRLGVLASLVSTFGAMPYIALQLIGLSRAWSYSTGTQLAQPLMALLILAVLTGFSLLFGTRRPSLTQHSRGLVSMVALESCVKLGALVCVAGVAVWLVASALNEHESSLRPFLDNGPKIDLSFVTMTILCTLTAFTLPRQFHLGFVTLENVDDVRTARWLVPVYFLLWPLATFVIATALRSGFEPPNTAPDMLLLGFARAQGGHVLEIIALLGGLSAGAAMVVVEITAISAMISNELAIPWLARSTWARKGELNSGAAIIQVRRWTTDRKSVV